MNRKIRLLVSSIVVLVTVGAVQHSEAQTPSNVTAVVERTKANRATYSLYNWYRISRAGEPAVEEWAAEFNSGRFHRVETPRDRVIADCEAMTGSALSLSTGQIVTGPQVAAAACGINTNFTVTSAEWLGQDTPSFGGADIVKLSGGPFIRTYEVDSKGIVVRSTFRYDAPGAPLALQTVSTDLSFTLLADDMFTNDSLSRSYVPATYRSGPVGHRWTLEPTSPS
jgi:hypothetical protein